MARSAEGLAKEKLRKAAWNAARRKTQPAPIPSAPVRSGGGSKSG